MSEEKPDPYSEGYETAGSWSEGSSSAYPTNPYPKDSEEHDQWEKGLADGFDDWWYNFTSID